jgi:hypothetical protein
MGCSCPASVAYGHTPVWLTLTPKLAAMQALE